MRARGPAGRERGAPRAGAGSGEPSGSSAPPAGRRPPLHAAPPRAPGLDEGGHVGGSRAPSGPSLGPRSPPASPERGGGNRNLFRSENRGAPEVSSPRHVRGRLTLKTHHQRDSLSGSMKGGEMPSSAFTGYFNWDILTVRIYQMCLGRALEGVGSQSIPFLLSGKLLLLLIWPS